MHRWLGLTTGLVVFIVAITGCIYVFASDLQDIFYRDRLYVEAQEGIPRLPASELITRAEAALDNKYPFFILSYSPDPDKSVRLQAYQFNQEKQTGLVRWYGDEIDYFYRAYLNPYTGELLKMEHTKWEFFNVVEFIHTSLLLGQFGRTVVSYAVLLFVFILISGIVLWWPRNKAMFKKGTRFSWTDRTRWKRKNFDLHNVLGFYSMWIALVIAITGLVWSFTWVNDGLQWLANGGQTVKSSVKSVQSDTTKIVVPSDLPLDWVYADVGSVFPEADQFIIVIPRSREGAIIVYGRTSEDITGFMASYDQYTGQELDRYSTAELSNGEQLRWLNYSIHVGSILGMPGKVLAFLASMTCAFLPVSGFLIWWNRRPKKKRKSPGRTKALPSRNKQKTTPKKKQEKRQTANS
ncbi:MAG: PepSY-associated TM helix domain-containing protein [Bacteroidota bacterium]